MRHLLALTAALPVLLFAFPTGPGPRRTGGPGDSGNCAGGSCHIGSAVRGEGVTVHLPNGPFYRPGVPQVLVLHVTGLSTEPQTARYGFQFSPRVGDRSGGAITSTTPDVWVQCEDASDPIGGNCPSAWPLQFAQHGRPSRLPFWTITWTPPADADGPITLFLAGNAANGLGDQIGDRIFLHSITVHPAGPVAYRSPFGGAGAAPGAWLELHARGLPTRDISVTVDGIATDISFVSESQINILLPSTLNLGLREVEISYPGGASIRTPIHIESAAPSFLPPANPVAWGQRVELLGTGCGTASTEAELRIAHRAFPAALENAPGQPGLCRVRFDTPDLPPSEYPFHICIAGRCNSQFLSLQVAGN